MLFEKRAAHDKTRASKLIHSNQHSQHPKKNKEQPETRKIQESSEREIDSDEKKNVFKSGNRLIRHVKVISMLLLNNISYQKTCILLVNDMQ